MSHELMNLFAVPVYKAPLGRAFSETEQQYFRNELRDATPAVANFSSRNKAVLNAPAMQGIRTFIQEHLDRYFRTVYDTANNVELRVTQSWLALTRKGQSHHTHTHPNSVVSGVLYINLAEHDGINFYRNDDLQWYELMPREQNYYNAYRYFIETRIGDIVLFPSNVKHGVREMTEDVERVSLAFNTFFSGELGRDGYSNALNITVNS